MDVNPYRSPEPVSAADLSRHEHDAADSGFPPTEPFQEPRTFVVLLLYASVAVDGFNAVGAAVQMYLLSAFRDGGVEAETLHLSDRIMAVPQLLTPLFYVATAIAWWIWQLRAAHNLRSFSGRHYEFTPGWTIGWYFVPILNLVRPYQAMREIVKASDPGVRFDDGSWAAQHSAPIVGCWWGLWLLSNFLANVTLQMPTDTLDQLLVALPVGIFENLLSVVLALTAAAMIRGINRNQRQKAGPTPSMASMYGPAFR